MKNHSAIIYPRGVKGPRTRLRKVCRNQKSDRNQKENKSTKQGTVVNYGKHLHQAVYWVNNN